MKNEIRCGGCGRLLGLTTREQAVRAQCLDPACTLLPAVQQEEARNGAIWAAYDAGESASAIARELGITRQGVGKAVDSRYPSG